MSTAKQKVAPPGPSELQIHISLVAQLRGRVVQRLRDDVVMFHCPNGEARDARTGAKLKAMGVLPGVADLIFIWRANVANHRPIVLFLELKAPGKKPSETQLLFAERAKAAGAYYSYADNIDDALASVGNYGLLK